MNLKNLRTDILRQTSIPSLRWIISGEHWRCGMSVVMLQRQRLWNLQLTLQRSLSIIRSSGNVPKIRSKYILTLLIKNFSINSAYRIPVKETKVLWLGDSITQGYGPLRSSETYVSIVNRSFNWDIINQGIGGYIYDKNSLIKMPGYDPDKIVVALGTNQYEDGPSAVEEYYKTLIDIYGTEIPVLCISPVWRGDHIDELSVFYGFCNKVMEIAGRYPNIRVINGFELVPHLEVYFIDNLQTN